ncbi:VOC family protein [Parvibaculum sp.]|uniref:VOC family protein n=1 Tax=Parvibaculum sp. TaxID=2024848 RepID=UPI002FDAAA24
MKLKLHHINVVSHDVPGLDAFYRDIMDLETEPGMTEKRKLDEGYPGAVSFMTDGNIQMHLAEKDLGIGFRTGQAVNPVEKGHIAFRTDDMDAFIERLVEYDIPYSDFGDWAMEGWRQIFFYDPAGNVIEVHQVEGED